MSTKYRSYTLPAISPDLASFGNILALVIHVSEMFLDGSLNDIDPSVDQSWSKSALRELATLQPTNCATPKRVVFA